LDQRLRASFQIVADRLNEVYKSMGEMQTLATGVGDLKRLLTNVKTRGAWGEVTLGNLLEEMMAPDQYERNVEIVPGSNQRVEYAVRLPGDGEVPVWLPLDAKFPMEDYDRLLDASQRGDVDAVEAAARAIETIIRGSARTISERYIQSPHSTDFAVLFLPTEGLFAEVVRRPGLVDALQREWHIMVAGPTTLLSLLVSLRVGFRSLAIQKHSNEVWKVLAAVKTEFGKFGGILDKVSRKLQETQNVIDVEVGRRRRLLTAVVAAVVTTWLALPRFRSERWWEKNFAVYTSIIEALQQMSSAFNEDFDEQQRASRLDESPKSTQLREKYQAANDEIWRAIGLGGSLFLLKRLQNCAGSSVS
jgi:DNA recombination protein RmuC